VHVLQNVSHAWTFLYPLDVTSWSRVVLGKVTVTQIDQTFISVFTRTHHWTLPWTRWIQSTPYLPPYLRSILILPSSLKCLGIPFSFSYQLFCILSHRSHACYMPDSSHCYWFHHHNILRAQIIKFVSPPPLLCASFLSILFSDIRNPSRLWFSDLHWRWRQYTSIHLLNYMMWHSTRHNLDTNCCQNLKSHLQSMFFL
jgi:hypothetical protein